MFLSLNKFPLPKTNLSFLLIHRRQEPDFMKLRSRKTLILSKPKALYLIDDNVPTDDKSNSIVKQCHPFKNIETEDVCPLGTVNGIVLLRYGYMLILYNPFTSMSKKRSFPPAFSGLPIYGFGYNANSDDLKVVRFRDGCEIYDVYNVKKSSWSSLNTSKYKISVKFGHEVEINLPFKRELNMPPNRTLHSNLLGTIDGCLCALHHTKDDRFDILIKDVSEGQLGLYKAKMDVDSVVTLDQVPRWSDGDLNVAEDHSLSFHDPLLTIVSSSANGPVSRFPVDDDINSKIYLWRGNPWNLEVDAVVNSTNENMDKAHCSQGLHDAAGPGLAEECGTLGGCRTGMAKVTNAYDLPARRVIHTVGPKYAVKYHTAAENALSHCYRSCLELLVENGLQSIAMGCIYTEAKNYPREPAAHVAIRTIRRFLEKQKYNMTALVFCTTTENDTEIYKRLLPLYFPRDKKEETFAITKLPADVGDENGETIIDERKIRIKPLPNMEKPVTKPPQASVDVPARDRGLARRNSSHLESYLDPAFMSLIKDPDQQRNEQRKKTAQAQKGFNFAKILGFGDLGVPPLSATEEYSLHSRYLAKANSLNLSEIAEMKIVYRGGVDSEGRPVMVVVGAHFLLRCLDLERFVLYIVKEFEPLIQKSYTIVYFHSAASLQVQPDLGWMRKLQQILGRKSQRNLHAIYILHPTFGLKAAVFTMQLLVDGVVWKKVIYVDRLLQLFKYVPREQLTIPDFVFQHDLEVNGGKGTIVDPRTKYAYERL
ncbi:hypothetical protein QVD17_03512 [Tagetes erecta]|uniref:Protein GDAP2 homolog n=1 Tax=Tagetes erecta TaxID=13708 RepID=A0AAD8PA12_TARER|nr:hypothetical protein QVD17_03512 [Tagetes erecta]